MSPAVRLEASRLGERLMASHQASWRLLGALGVGYILGDSEEKNPLT